MKAVLFDLDGTICDTLLDLHYAINAGLTAYGHQPVTFQQTKARLGNGIKNLMIASVESGEDDPDLDGIIAQYKAYYLEHCTDNTKPYDGIVDLVKELKSEGYKLGVITNKINEAAQVICETFFPGLFDIVIGELPADLRKPNAYGLQLAAEKLGVSLTDCLYVGDSEVDVKFAQNAAVSSILCCWGTRTKQQLEAAGASVIVETADQLKEAICH